MLWSFDFRIWLPVTAYWQTKSILNIEFSHFYNLMAFLQWWHTECFATFWHFNTQMSNKVSSPKIARLWFVSVIKLDSATKWYHPTVLMRHWPGYWPLRYCNIAKLLHQVPCVIHNYNNICTKYVLKWGAVVELWRVMTREMCYNAFINIMKITNKGCV